MILFYTIITYPAIGILLAVFRLQVDYSIKFIYKTKYWAIVLLWPMSLILFGETYQKFWNWIEKE
jgi:hypothetical protein